MGRGSSTSQPALATLMIHLNHPTDKVYQPGDLVSGHVTVTPTAPLLSFDLELSIFGRSLVWYIAHNGRGSSTHYEHDRDNAPLFETVRPLQRVEESALRNFPDHGVPGSTYLYKFEFCMPEDTAHSRLGQYRNDEDDRWFAGPHRLPPTFLHTTNVSTSTDPNFAKVEYGIKARLPCQSDSIVKREGTVDVIAEAPILFQPHNPHLQDIQSGQFSLLRHSKTFALQSSLLAGNKPSQIGFRQSLHDRFSSSTPIINFDVTISIPDLLMCGSTFRFQSCFTIISKSDDVTYIPQVTFSVIEVELLALTFVRAQHDEEASFSSDGSHGKHHKVSMPAPDKPYTKRSRESQYFAKKLTRLNVLPARTTVELADVPGSGEAKTSEKATSCEAWFTARLPENIAPSFKSFALSRAYKLKVKLGVEVGGKHFECSAESHVRELCSAAL